MTSPRERLRPWQPWSAVAGFGLVLHFAWEMAQAPLYVHPPGVTRGLLVLHCGRAALGDVAIALLSYGGVALAARRRLWLLDVRGWPAPLFLAIGLGITLGLEWLNVYLLHRWAYAPAMPLVFGVGLTPLLQWIVLPPLNLWLARRHLDSAQTST